MDFANSPHQHSRQRDLRYCRSRPLPPTSSRSLHPASSAALIAVEDVFHDKSFHAQPKLDCVTSNATKPTRRSGKANRWRAAPSPPLRPPGALRARAGWGGGGYSVRPPVRPGLRFCPVSVSAWACARRPKCALQPVHQDCFERAGPMPATRPPGPSPAACQGRRRTYAGRHRWVPAPRERSGLSTPSCRSASES